MIPEGEFGPEGPLKPRRPWWFTVILVIMVFPAFGMPWMMASAPEGSMLQTLIKLYPAYLALSAVCAWLCYPQRRELAWILVALMALSSSALLII